MSKISLRNILIVLILPIVFGLIFIGCQKKERALSFENVGSNKSISVLDVQATKAKVPMGNTQFNIFNSKIDPEELFGPPVTEAWARDGHVFLICRVMIEADSDKEWLNLVGSAHLTDDQGNEHRLDLWYFKDAYRGTLFMESAEGMGLGSKTRLGFQIKEPLPTGLKLISNQEEVALIK